MRDADHNHIIELLPAYALGALDADDARVVRQHLVTCASCQSELAAFETVVDAMPLAAPGVDPSPGLKGRLIESIQTEATEEHTTINPQIPSQPVSSLWHRLTGAMQGLFSGPRWQPVALLLIAALLVSNVLLWLRVNEPAANAPAFQLITLTATEAAPEASGLIYISTDGEYGTLIVESLPQLDSGQQYQLWLIRDGERASGGVFSVTADGYYSLHIRSPRPLDEFGAFGITIEPEGGSPGPTGDRVLGFNL